MSVNAESHFCERWCFGVWPERVISMLNAQLEQAVATARSYQDLDHISRILWKGYGEGLVSDSGAEAITAAIEARRLIFGSRRPIQPPSPVLAAPKRSRSPNRQASLERRRKAATSGAVPSRLAAHFTIGELAVLAVVAGEVKRRGLCEWPLDRIAAQAGVSRSTTQNALRQAKKLGLLTVTERRYRGRASGFNTVRITDALWLSWLRLGGGYKNLNTTYNKNNKPKQESAKSPCRSPSVLVHCSPSNKDSTYDDSFCIR